MLADTMLKDASPALQIRSSRLPSRRKSLGDVRTMTATSLLDDASALTPSFGRTSTPRGRREHADRRHSTLWPAGYGDEGFGVREDSLTRLLIDDEDNLNRLYNIVSQIGLHVLLFDRNGRLIGRYGRVTEDDHERARPEPTFNWVSAGTAVPEHDIAPARSTAFEETAEAGGRERSPRFVGLPDHPAPDHPANALDRALSMSAGGPRPSSVAARLLDPEGQLLGLLDVLPDDGGLTVEARALAKTFLRTTARAIDERAFRRRYYQAWIIALATPDGGPGMLLAVDGRQRIVGADGYARSTLSGRNVDLESSPILWALFEKDASLFRSNNGDVRTALATVGGGQIWGAVVTPPTSPSLHRYIPEYSSLHSRPRLDSIGCFRRAAPPASSVGGVAPRALQRIREYIEQHLEENIELEVLAGIAALSKWHFARAFKQSVGVPPHFYLMQRRLELARKLLAETELSLGQIALKTGFSDQSHFSHRFRVFFGTTPRSFRRWKR
jgi:AraC-like DNA-binding protein